MGEARGPAAQRLFIGECLTCKVEVSAEITEHSYVNGMIEKQIRAAVLDHSNEPIPAPL